MRGKQWSKTKQIEALRCYARTENCAEVSRQTGVPNTTIDGWVKQNPKLIEEFKAEYWKGQTEAYLREVARFKEEFAPKVRARLLDCVARVAEVLEKAPLTGKSRLRGQELSALIRELVQALQLIEGEPTERHEHTVWDRIEKAIEEEEKK